MGRVLDSLKQRGMFSQVTNEAEVAKLLDTPGNAIYVGFDPTADSLHVGHMLPIMGLAMLQRAGHIPIALVGGATGMVGDPSGRSTERNLLTADEVRHNSECIRKQLMHFLDFSGSNAAIMENNADWTEKLTAIEWLRDVGKHFTINYMLAKESVKRRVEDRESGVSYTEFSYMILQANDFLQLFRRHNCRLQAGGSDQWGNITAGIDLIRRVTGTEAFGITFPLVTTSSGEKFGKSAGNAVWLDPARTSPYRFYQYWLQTEDADVEKFLGFFSFLPWEEIQAISAEHMAAPERRVGQRRLAEEVTRLVHGEAELQRAMNASKALFGGSLNGLEKRDLDDIFADVPSATMDRSDMATGIGIVDLLVKSGMCASNGEARRMVQGGGIYVNNERVGEPAATFGPDALLADSVIVLRSGKKNYRLVRFG
ncbi:MAG TPA: tyrosine--tRNA ligase [Myxococcota bacterium]|nr:tyrosine--tRNA ligase [Myxococcota bacterium]HOH77977.1 tyrosine--tRNA ligase [Myxococcota bacterium]